MDDGTVKKRITLNDGRGLYSTSGLCDQLIKLANEITIKGAQNAHLMYLVVSGIEHIRDTIRKEGWENEQGHDSAEAEDI